MEPDDRIVDRDADPTRVRLDRQQAHRMPEDADASPTRVRPRVTDADGRDSHSRDSDSEAVDRWVGPILHSGQRPPDEDRFDDEGDAGPTTDQPADHSSQSSHPRQGWAPVQQWRLEPAGATHGDADAAGSGPGPDPDGAPTTVLTLAHDSERRHRRRDWAWVEEWRAERSAPAWGPGIAMGIFVALIVAVALIVLTSGVSDSPVLAVVFNVVIAAGMAPALWLCRSLPVLRFLAAGAAAGILFGWIAMITTF